MTNVSQVIEIKNRQELLAIAQGPVSPQTLEEKSKAAMGFCSITYNEVAKQLAEGTKGDTLAFGPVSAKKQAKGVNDPMFPMKGCAGMFLALFAFLENIDSNQTYNAQGLIPLALAVSTQNQAASQTMMDKISGPGVNSDASLIAQALSDAQNNKGNYQEEMSNATSQLTIDNTKLGQINTFYSGLGNALNQSSSDASQTIQLDLQMYEQGPQSQLQTLAQIL
jgi:hypothetical protein